MNKLIDKKIWRIIVFIFLLLSISILVWNLDMFIRFIHSYQNGTLTEEKIRLDIASFDLGRKPSVSPIDVITSATDGMVQVYVPKGEFIMGTPHHHIVPDFPVHAVYLDAFWMDKFEVTNAMYLKCLQAHGCTTPVSDNSNYDKWIYRDHPIVYIVWAQANEYCQWAGRRLPTEAEWEKAARGTDQRMYPWGSDPISPRLANFTDSLIHESVSSFRYPLGASPYGALNMSGNVREWVADWYDPNYYSHSPYANPKGPATGFERSLRSGSYNEADYEVVVTRRFHHQPQSAGLSRGFRCAQDQNVNN